MRERPSASAVFWFDGTRPYQVHAERACEKRHPPATAGNGCICRHIRVSRKAARKLGEVAGRDDDVAAAFGVGLQLVAHLASAAEFAGHDDHRVAFERPQRRVAQQAIGDVTVGRGRDETGFVVEVGGVLVAGIQQVEHGVGEVIAGFVRPVAPDAIDIPRVEMARKRPAGIEVQQQRHRRVHDARLAVLLHPALRGLLDAADGRKLVALEPAVLETDRDAVVEDVRVEQPLHQAQARALGGAVRIAAAAARGAVGLVAPAIEDRGVAEPRHAVLLARAAVAFS